MWYNTSDIKKKKNQRIKNETKLILEIFPLHFHIHLLWLHSSLKSSTTVNVVTGSFVGFLPHSSSLSGEETTFLFWFSGCFLHFLLRIFSYILIQINRIILSWIFMQMSVKNTVYSASEMILSLGFSSPYHANPLAYKLISIFIDQGFSISLLLTFWAIWFFIESGRAILCVIQCLAASLTSTN